MNRRFFFKGLLAVTSVAMVPIKVIPIIGPKIATCWASYTSYTSTFKWKIDATAVSDWRYITRIANIETSK